MRDNISSEFVIEILKKAINIRKNTKDKKTKALLMSVIEYIRIKFISQTKLSQRAFINFYNNPDNERILGKLETWIDIALRDGDYICEELVEQINVAAKIISKETGEYKPDNEAWLSPTMMTIKEVQDKEKGGNPIIVPWDFSEIGRYALNHALKYAKVTKDRILLLHIIDENSDVKTASKKLQGIVNVILKKVDVEISYLIAVGNILRTITQTANKHNCRFVVMGSRAVEGVQRFTGSLAVKVISGTNNPFIIVQNNPVSKTIKTAVIPIEKDIESIQKLKQARILSSFFDVKYTLTIPEDVVNKQVARKMLTNLEYTEKYMKKHNLDYEVVYIGGTQEFTQAALTYIKDNKPDMMIIYTSGKSSIHDYVLGAKEQRLIINQSGTPVMCVNPSRNKCIDKEFKIKM